MTEQHEIVTDDEREQIQHHMELIEDARAEAAKLLRGLQKKYKLGPADEIEPYTGIIRRKG